MVHDDAGEDKPENNNETSRNDDLASSFNDDQDKGQLDPMLNLLWKDFKKSLS